ncbi:MAG TPA: response regulator transcription factor [Mycobacteriales bacterium]
MPSVLICIASPVVRQRLALCAAGIAGMGVVGTAASGREALARYTAAPADLVLVDAALTDPDGVQTTRLLAGRDPAAAVLVVGVDDDPALVTAAMVAGARGFLRVDLSREDLAIALAHALAGDLPGSTVRGQEAARRRVALTERELQVLRGMCEGKSNGEIGRELYLSEDTVKTHARRLFRKLGVNDRAHAVASGFRLGIVS